MAPRAELPRVNWINSLAKVSQHYTPIGHQRFFRVLANLFSPPRIGRSCRDRGGGEP